MADEFAVVVVIGLAIFGMFWIGSQAEGGIDFGLSSGDEPDSMLLYSSEPGKIGQSNEDFRTVNFGDFTVGETRGKIQAYTKERAQISNGLLSGKEIVVNYNATQPGQGQVSFEVLGRQSMGEIFVRVNGNEVFKAATVSGATPEINISQNNFRNGMNKIVIGTTQSSLLEKSIYTLEDIEVTVEDRKFHDYTSYFQMYDHELNNFRPSNITFNVPVDSSTPQEPLRVTVNENNIFTQRIGRSTQEITITPQNADLQTGYNTIEFGTEGESKYTIKNAEVQLRYSVKVEPAKRNLKFSLTQNRLDYVKKESTKETLTFTYQKQTTAQPVEIQLNNAFYTVQPENGVNTIELEEEIFQKENTLSIQSNQTFTMKNLQIISEKEK